MARPIGLFLVCLGLAGCHSQSGNPFMRTTVPPPGTGAGSPTDPYYNNSGASAAAKPATTSAAPATTPTQPVVPPPEKRFTAPGGMNLPLGSVNHRKAVDPQAGEVKASATAVARTTSPRDTPVVERENVSLASAETKDVPEAEDAKEDFKVEADESVEESVTAPHRFAANNPIRPASNQALPIPQFEDEGEVPTARPVMRSQSVEETASATGTVRFAGAEDSPADEAAETSNTTVTQAAASDESTARSPGGLRVASANSDFDNAADDRTAAPAVPQPKFYYDRHSGVAQSRLNRRGGATSIQPGGSEGEPDAVQAKNYAYHSDYQWLKGKLEYSPASRRWKLRYIPLDGDTDGFGGSVVLGNPPQLTGFNPGDWVLVRGQVAANPDDAGGFSPPYQLTAIEKQTD